jgi:hypothetical protein
MAFKIHEYFKKQLIHDDANSVVYNACITKKSPKDNDDNVLMTEGTKRMREYFQKREKDFDLIDGTMELQMRTIERHGKEVRALLCRIESRLTEEELNKRKVAIFQKAWAEQ